MAVCLNISTVINIKILTNINQQTQSYKFTSHIAAFLSVVLITEMLEIWIQTYDQNAQLILKSYLPVVYGTLLSPFWFSWSQKRYYLVLQSFEFEHTRWPLFQKLVVHTKLDIYICLSIKVSINNSPLAHIPLWF